jgi:hypothetical protein
MASDALRQQVIAAVGGGFEKAGVMGTSGCLPCCVSACRKLELEMQKSRNLAQENEQLLRAIDAFK